MVEALIAVQSTFSFNMTLREKPSQFIQTKILIHQNILKLLKTKANLKMDFSLFNLNSFLDMKLVHGPFKF